VYEVVAVGLADVEQLLESGMILFRARFFLLPKEMRHVAFQSNASFNRVFSAGSKVGGLERVL
jgi:hypothetical protein